MQIGIWGDSITWGAYDPENGGWATLLRNYYEQRGDFSEVYNLGISGDNSKDILQRFEIEAAARKPELIIFAFGINDSQFIHSKNALCISEVSFQQNLESVLSLAKKFTEKIIFIGLTDIDEPKTTPIPWDKDISYTTENANVFDKIIEDFCTKNNLQFISMKAILEKEDLPDGLHPNTAGHQKMFNVILSQIQK